MIGDYQNQRALIARQAVTFFLDNGLFQMCNLQNNKGNVLDLILTNNPECVLVEKADMLLIPEDEEDKSHVQMVCSLDFNPVKYNTDINQTPIYCFRRADYDNIRLELSSIDLSNIIENDDINEMVQKFYDAIYSILDKFVPKVVPRKSNEPSWHDYKLSNLKNIRNKEYKKLCENRKSDQMVDDSIFQTARDNFDSYHKKLYEEYVKEIVNESNKNPKQLWSHINGKRKSNSLPCKMEYWCQCHRQ